MNRRSFFSTTVKSALISAVAASLSTRLGAADSATGSSSSINHSVCKWCYKGVSLDELATAGREIGLQSIELLTPADFPTLRKYGLTCAMMAAPAAKTPDGTRVGGITRAFNRIEHHDTLVAAYQAYMKESAKLGAKQVICFSGNRDGMSDEEGLENCAAGLKRLMPLAEKLGLTISMELLNSKVNHKDYMADKSDWGVALCEKIGSRHFGLLYDIYHMQIMEGDVIATINKHHQWFSHYHTGGVPGRHEIDDTQELNYGAIMRAIAATGYKGHVGQEFIPSRKDKLASLKQAVSICSV
ncbi:MAG: hydroxypyruvate isomerase family protein [Verrucomicrobiales bacterium]